MTALFFVLAGCATLGSFQTADPIPAGNVQVGVEPYVIATRSQHGHDAGSRLALALRVGLDDRTEVGLRTGSALPEVMLKRRLTPPGASPVLSTAPSAGFVVGPAQPRLLVYGQVPVLVGIDTGRAGQLVVGPKLHVVSGVATRGGGWGFLLTGGTSLGWAARITSGFRLVPEVTVGVPLVGAGPGELGLAPGVVVQGGVGILVGGGG